MTTAGQLLNLPMLIDTTETSKATVISCTPTTTSSGSREGIDANEILIDFKHTFTFKAPLPKGARSVTMDTKLVIYSTKDGIVRLQDRTDADIPDNSILTVSLPKRVYMADA